MEMARLPLFEFGRLLYLDGNLGVEVAERHEWQRRDEQALRVLAEDHVGGVLRHFERKRVLQKQVQEIPLNGSMHGSLIITIYGSKSAYVGLSSSKLIG